MRKRISWFALLFIAVALSVVVYTRYPSVQLRAASSRLKGPYPTEEAWIVNEIVRDVVEMAAYPAKATIPAVASASDDGQYRVSFPSGPVELDLRDDLWSPDRFAAVATAAFAARRVERSPATGPFQTVYLALLDFTPEAIVDASERVSRALSLDVQNARAHEAAALILGTFALREAAGRFGDNRWALNRMTAHLALASLPDDAPGIDGRLAGVVLLVLTNHQVRALDALDRLQRDAGSKPVAAWARALRLRVTQDWRGVDAPESASRLEQEEFIRARRATVSGSRAAIDLQRVGASPDAAWIRLIENSSMGVEDGWLGTEAFDFEDAEYRDVFQRLHRKGLGAEVADALNARATRCIGSDGPRVLPWGAWAEFAQRHLMMFMDRHDRFYLMTLGNSQNADEEKAKLTRLLGKLTMFPVATVFWTKGPRGSEADLMYLKDAVAAVLRSPERVTPTEWAFLELATHYEAVVGGIPAPATWFIPASPRVPQNAGPRLKAVGSSHVDVISAVLKDAPYDYAVASEYLTLKYGVRAPYAEVRRLLGPRLEYDTRALSTAEQFAPTADDRVMLLRTSCELSAHSCLSLAWELASDTREPEAAAVYRKAFDDPAIDAVEISNYSGWLVNYDFRGGRVDDALALAERSAGTKSWQGLVTYAYLAERLGRMEEAEATYREAATHYRNPSQLLGFYYRAVTVRKDMRYEAAWKTELERVFPHGLTPVPIDAARPAHAVVMNSDSERSRRAGLLIGDLIVGLEGHQVESYEQYRAVNAFFEQDEMKLTVWRGDKLLPIAVTAPNRTIGVQLRTYPVEGWSEK